MRSMKKLGTAVAAVSMLMALGAGSASAANFDPANTTLTAHGTLTLDAVPSTLQVHCTYHSGVRSAGGADAFTTETGGTTPAPPTFSNCAVTGTTGTVTASADAAWTITATSTTVVDVTGNATVTISTALGDCKITVGDVNVPATWTQATNTLVPEPTLFTVSEVGPVCPGDTQARITGDVTVPGLTIT